MLLNEKQLTVISSYPLDRVIEYEVVWWKKICACLNGFQKWVSGYFFCLWQ